MSRSPKNTKRTFTLDVGSGNTRARRCQHQQPLHKRLLHVQLRATVYTSCTVLVIILVFISGLFPDSTTDIDPSKSRIEQRTNDPLEHFQQFSQSRDQSALPTLKQDKPSAHSGKVWNPTCDTVWLDAQHDNAFETGTISISPVPRLLKHDQLIESSVGEGEYNFYQVCLKPRKQDTVVKSRRHTAKHLRIRFIVHAIPIQKNEHSKDQIFGPTHTQTHTGDPDLYVSINNMLPTLATSDFISASLGDEVLELTTELEDIPDDIERMFISVLGRTKGHYNVGVWVEEYTVPVRGLRGALI